MLLNTKCERCNEPTKHVVGFWDGENGKSGFVHDCENEKCEVRQLIKATETKAMQDRFRIQNLNSRKRMYAGYIAALRKDAKISMMEMSKIAGCNPAEYSAYEHERKPFDEEAYRKCEEYLLKNEKKCKASGLTVSERLLLLGPFTGDIVADSSAVLPGMIIDHDKNFEDIETKNLYTIFFTSQEECKEFCDFLNRKADYKGYGYDMEGKLVRDALMTETGFTNGSEQEEKHE